LHLARRFFGYISADPPTSDELDTVRTHLNPGLFDLFVMMSHQDQRHAIEVAQRIDRDELVEAALLHDVGKSVVRLGAVGRSCATIAGALPLPLPGSWELYLKHGEIGGSMLERSGAGPLTVAFARFHPGAPPAGISSEDWHALERADDL
jgi:hypothetical protein